MRYEIKEMLLTDRNKKDYAQIVVARCIGCFPLLRGVGVCLYLLSTVYMF